MTEATVQQPATTTREQIWLNHEQVRKEKPVYRALKRVQDVFFSLLALPSGVFTESAAWMRFAAVILCGSLGGFLGVRSHPKKHLG